MINKVGRFFLAKGVKFVWLFHHPAEQRHRAQPRDHLSPLELVSFGRQPQRVHHRGIHHHREQGFTNHQKVNGYEENQEIILGRILETP